LLRFRNSLSHNLLTCRSNEITKSLYLPHTVNLIISNLCLIDNSPHLANINPISSRPFSISSDGNGQSQCFCKGILLCFFDPADLLFPFANTSFFGGFIVWSVSVRLRVPVEISSLLPSSNRCHETMTQVIFTVLRQKSA